jgi:predicted SAM-dependent methyltransferase
MKLHLGCGKRILKGYIHIDLSNYDHIDYHHDIRTLPMIKDNSVDLIYASHVFEYFDRFEAKKVLAEWYRTLRNGGILRLAVPNFEVLSKIYQSSKNLDLIIGPMYGRWEIKENLIGYHKTVYDFKSLSNILYNSKFKTVRHWDWKKVFIGKFKDYDDYSKSYIPHLDFVSGVLTSLNVEAIK